MGKKLTINSIVSETKIGCTREQRAAAFLVVGDDVVWDYKVQEGKVCLISEPYDDLLESEYVTFGEVSDYINQENPDFRDVPIVSEHTGKALTKMELLETTEENQLVIRLS